jgi:hypothetical protein
MASASAIKTYNGEGVAAAGVIPFYHAIIYTGRKAPQPSREEMRTIARPGHMERMQPHPIRVQQYDLTQALDSMARLDFTDVYELDYNYPVIRLLGKVHNDSHAAFITQYKSVWSKIRSAAGGTSGLDIDDRNTAKSHTSYEESTLRAAAPSTVATADTAVWTGSGAPVQAGAENSSEDGEDDQAGSNEVSDSLGIISEAQMRQILQQCEAYAVAKGYSMPGEGLNKDRVLGLARYPIARARYLQLLKSRWEDEKAESDARQRRGSRRR